MAGMSLGLLSFSYFLSGWKEIIQLTLLPLLFQLYKMLRASPTFSDLLQSLFEAKDEQMGYNWDGAKPRLG